jgi:hypothetical protein
VPISYIGALQSTLLHAIVQVLRNLLNVLVQTANEMGLQTKIEKLRKREVKTVCHAENI